MSLPGTALGIKHVLDIDIETYSTLSIKKTNVYAYSEDPAFEVLMCAWSLDGGPITVTVGEREIREIPGLFDPTVTKRAHNAGFERVCLSRMYGMPTGTYLPPEEWIDTAAIAASKGLPRALDALARALRVTPKDTAGTRLINLFCAPVRGRRVMPADRPEEWEQFCKYCGTDVEAMQEAAAKIGGWATEFERRLWCVDQRINDRGVLVDLPMAEKAVGVSAANDEASKARVREITGIENPGSTVQLGAWCDEVGYPLANWQAETVRRALEDLPGWADDRQEVVREVLELRQELALVAKNKYAAAVRSVSEDGRLRGQFMYHAAHTGRWSSMGVQVHNLPKKGFERKDGGRDLARQGAAIFDLMNGFGAHPTTLKKLVRPLFVSPRLYDPDGDPFTVSDFSAIEARVLAWQAGEQWVLEAFRQGRDLYVETAERMGGGMGRPEGKIAVLAAGYQGSVGSFRNMGYGGRRCPFDIIIQKPVKDPRTGRVYDKPFEDMAARAVRAIREDEDPFCEEAVRDFVLRARRKKLSPEAIGAAIGRHVTEKRRDPDHKCDIEIKEIVTAWREANSRIVSFWYDLEEKFWTGGRVGAGHVYVERFRNRRRIVLPSGRMLTYYEVDRKPVEIVDPETDRVRTKEGLSYRHVRGYREKTYGGRLTENVTQAIARDLLADAMVRLDEAGYRVVLHVHDEVVVESDDVEGITKIMRDGPEWAAGLPLDASGELVERYTK